MTLHCEKCGRTSKLNDGEELKRIVKSLGGKLYITGVKKEFSKMIKLSGLESIVEISYGEE